MSYNIQFSPGGQYFKNDLAVSSPYTANTSTAMVFCQFTGASTVYLPAIPKDGEYHYIKESSGDAVNFGNITVDGNGKNIGTGTTLTISTINAAVVVVFDSTYNKWRQF